MSGYREALARLHDAARADSKISVDVDLRLGERIKLEAPYLIGSCVSALGWEACERAYEGKSGDAAESIFAMLRAAESLEYEPFFQSQQYRTLCTAYSVRLLGDLLPAINLPADDRQILMHQLEDSEYDRSALVRCQQAERGVLIAICRNPDLRYPQGTIADADLALMLDIMADGEAALAKPWRDGGAELRRLDARIASIRRSIAGRLVYKATGLILPRYAVLARIAPQCLAYNRVGQTALAVDAYHGAHQRLPESLDQLIPRFLSQIPRDPIDGAQLRYLRQGTGSAGRRGSLRWRRSLGSFRVCHPARPRPRRRREDLRPIGRIHRDDLPTKTQCCR